MKQFHRDLPGKASNKISSLSLIASENSLLMLTKNNTEKKKYNVKVCIFKIHYFDTRAITKCD